MKLPSGKLVHRKLMSIDRKQHKNKQQLICEYWNIQGHLSSD